MKLLKILFVILVGSMELTVSSCDLKKDDEDTIVRDPRLREFRYYYEDDYPGSDDSSVISVTYNDRNLVKSMADTIVSLEIDYDERGLILQMRVQEKEEQDYFIDYVWSDNSVTLTESEYPNGKLVFQLNTDGNVVRMDSYSMFELQWYLNWYTVYFWENHNLVRTEFWEPLDKESSVKNNRYRPFPLMISDFKALFGGKNVTGAKQNFYKSVVVEYNYDAKKNPFRDIQLYWFTEVGYYASVNNVKSYTSTVYRTNGETDGVYNSEFTLNYNQGNYLSEKLDIHEDWFTREVYFYE